MYDTSTSQIKGKYRTTCTCTSNYDATYNTSYLRLKGSVVYTTCTYMMLHS